MRYIQPHWQSLSSLRGQEYSHRARNARKPFCIGQCAGEDSLAENSSADSSSEAKNDDWLVLGLRYQERAILLPGDAEKDAEREMLSENNQDELRAEVLKILHHGGRNSTTPDFLAAVKPRLGIISVGEGNAYGHP